MQKSREIELKLEVPSAAAGTLVARLGSNRRAKRLFASYYDTPSGALAERGISFRVRRTGDAYVQTIKTGGATGGALFNRAEWETALPGDEPDLKAIDEAGLRGALDKPGDWRRLQPVFSVDVERLVWDAESGGTIIEVAFDRGTVAAGGAQEAVSEVELELKAGSAAGLFGLARWLAEAVPVRLGVLTKADRGQRLLAGRAGHASKAGPIALPADASTAQAFGVIVESCLRHFRLNEPLIAKRDPNGLHQARVALRRLRSAISLFRGVVADERLGAIQAALRNLAATLGEARNLDVLIERLAGERELVDQLCPERDAAYDRANALLDTNEVRLLMLEVLEWAEIGVWRTHPLPDTAPRLVAPAREFAVRTLDKYRRRVRKRGAGLTGLDPDRRHELRLEAKKLRYCAEFFTGLFQGEKAQRRAGAFRSALETLQSRLGPLNDIATAQGLARALAAKGIAMPPRAWGDEGKLLRKAEAAHTQFLEAKPFWR